MRAVAFRVWMRAVAFRGCCVQGRFYLHVLRVDVQGPGEEQLKEGARRPRPHGHVEGVDPPKRGDEQRHRPRA
eukprot:783850-Pyramimonas_sp.AAC.2